MTLRRGSMRWLVGGLVAALLAGCGSSDGDGHAKNRTAAGFPVTVTSCGHQLTFDRPPRRVVILSPIVAHDLVALGVADRIVGQSGTDFVDPVAQTVKVPVLSHNQHTSTELLLGARPDLVITDLAYRLTPSEGGASLDRLRDAGVASYISAAGCSASGTSGTVTDEFTDLTSLGRIFGVPDKARSVLSGLKAQLAEVDRRVSGQAPVKAFVGTVYSGQYVPSSGVGLDALRRAGGISIFPHVDNASAPVSKEEITAHNPQVIVDAYYGSLDRDKALAGLRDTFPTTDAVKHNRLYFIGYVASQEPGSAVAMVAAIRELAGLLHPAGAGG